MSFLTGKKTYIVVGLLAVAFVLAIVFKVVVPEEIYGIMAALGLAAFRAAIADINGNTGWKTYLAAVAVFVISLLSLLGVALPLEIIYGVLSALGVVGVRGAVKKLTE